jgi:hypothetical protein
MQTKRRGEIAHPAVFLLRLTPVPTGAQRLRYCAPTPRATLIRPAPY